MTIENISRAGRIGADDRLATGLGWFSIGLGVAQIVAPGRLAQFIGVKDEDRTRAVLRAYGLREIAAGVGILSQPRTPRWLWSRVAGDLIDIASLGTALSSEGANRTRVGAAAAAMLGITALDVYSGSQRSRDSGKASTSEKAARRVAKSTTINRRPDEVYNFWHRFENLPLFMDALESVEVTGPRRSHWKANGPGGLKFEWDAEIIQDEPNSRISWRSIEGSEIDNSGTVRFERATGGRGTVVRAEMHYVPPAGGLGVKLAKLTGSEPGQQLEADLRKFKQILETGEVVVSDASAHRGMHSAQPLAYKESS
jgi:uncharacterized membrane protein